MREKTNSSVFHSLALQTALGITDTPIIRTAAKSPAKLNYRRLTEINSCYYGLSLLRTLTCSRRPEGVRNSEGSRLDTLRDNIFMMSTFRSSFCLLFHNDRQNKEMLLQ